MRQERVKGNFELGIDAQSFEEAEVVRRQLDAYNARDIDGFMACWANDAEVYAWPSDRIAKGAEEIRTRHIERFNEPDLFAHLVSRTAVDGLVVDREVVTRNFPQGRGTLDVIGIYELEAGKIKRAWFKQGVPVFGD
ncbi:nuclear transport factor 2 family protein [Novosphingobium sp. BL-8A]|uniref:nuclear transport factor 2 family protein n=1 Tax=Novosphingobium sp. BL-8A TaxID=3127639 RepID=UPI003757469B